MDLSYVLPSAEVKTIPQFEFGNDSSWREAVCFLQMVCTSIMFLHVTSYLNLLAFRDEVTCYWKTRVGNGADPQTFSKNNH